MTSCNWLKQAHGWKMVSMLDMLCTGAGTIYTICSMGGVHIFSIAQSFFLLSSINPFIHPSIRLLPLICRGGRSLSRETQPSLFLAERWSLQHVLGLPQGLLPVGHAWNTSPGRCKNFNHDFKWCSLTSDHVSSFVVKSGLCVG